MFIYVIGELKKTVDRNETAVKEMVMLDHVVRMFTEPRFKCNHKVLDKEVNLIQLTKQGLLDAGGLDISEVMSNDKFAALIRSEGVDPPMKMSITTGKRTYAFAKTDPGFNKLANHDSPKIRAMVKARLSNKSTIDETRCIKYSTISKVSPNGLIGLPLTYFGAKTGRLSGSGGMNAQNLTRGGALRRSLEAPEGDIVLAGDLSAIEARLVAYMAGSTKLLSLYKKGVDVYCAFGGEYLYKRKITKADFIERFLAKTAVLQLGYGAGKDRFKDSVNSQGVTQIDINEAERIVGVYRKQAYPEIPRLWYYLNDQIEAWVGNNKPIKLDLPVTIWLGKYSDFYPSVHGSPLYEKIKDIKCMVLPNGVPMFFNKIRHTPDGYVYNIGKKINRVYGASLLEKICQSVARIIISETEIEMEKEFDIKPALQVHDELVYVILEHLKTEFKAKFLECMRFERSWRKGLPTDGEVAFGKSYVDCK